MMKHMGSTVTDWDNEPKTTADAFASITMKELVFGALPPLCPENPDLRFGATEEV
jgi:hypothetical protein